MSLDNYYKTYDPAKRYQEIMFRVGNHLQGRELNDLQAMFLDLLARTGDAIMKDGDVTDGGLVNIDRDTGATTVSAAKVYIRGLVHNVAEANLVLATDSVQVLGIWLVDRVITELEDPGLRDPAEGAESYDEPGAGRREVTASWGLSTDNSPGNFYPVHRVDQGVQIINEPPPQLNAVTAAIARYDREANGGSYLVHGLEVLFRGEGGGLQVFNITEGKAHIEGFEIELPASLRKEFALDPDLQLIESEPNVFTPDGNGKMRIETDFSPIHDIRKIDIAAETTKTLNHGAYAGALDPLPDTSVVSIVSITQGGTTYNNGVDFKLTGNNVDWSLPGAEPAPGSSYNVTYRHRKAIAPESQDEDGLVISGAVPGSDVFLDYQWKLPRVDLVTLEVDGTVRKIKGVSQPYRPQAPAAPSNQLVLATVTQNWRLGEVPQIVDQAIRAVTMSELGRMRNQISDLYQLLALQQLSNSVNTETQGAKLGVLVDPFLDDSKRDAGIEQTAAVVNGELMLNIAASVHDLLLDANATLDYELEPIVEQMASTGAMKVNPYQAFEPVPAKVTLSPAVDNWVQTNSIWQSDTTRLLLVGSGLRTTTTESVSIESQVVSSRTGGTLRPRAVQFTLAGFGPGEVLNSVVFDGEVLPVNGA
ncbi:DUF4815 domain-containing protein [Rheinheimera sp.]|uniref:DUF4815 domain-containing protein n=1 Tax=Rheinheimera sp. TaxID=1869214 RepID=UPI00307CD732